MKHPLLLSMALAASVMSYTSAHAQQTVRVAWSIPAEEAKYWLMRRPAEFPDIGSKYKIEWVQYQGTSPVMQAMAAGAVDCGTQTPLTIAQASIQGGLDTYIVAQHVSEKPGSFSVYWAVKEDSPIKKVSDLKGKTIGLAVLGAGIYGPFVAHLKKNGIDAEKDVKLVETGFAPSEDAIRSGRVDVGVLNQPFAARAEAKGGLRKLFSVADEQPNMVHILEACRKEFMDKNPELARMYVRDLTAGMKKVMENRPETMKIVSEVTRAPMEVLDTYLLKDNDFARDPGAAPNFPAIQALMDTFTDTGLLTRKADVSRFKHPTIVAPLQ